MSTSVFHIKNFTRYNTEDLEQLLEFVEAMIHKKTSKIPDRQYVYPWKKQGGKISPILTLRETSPKTLYRRDYSDHEAETFAEGTVRVYCDSFVRRINSDIALVAPDLLFDTPMEAIANCGNISIAPNAAVRAWCRRFSFLYEDIFRWSSTKDVLTFPTDFNYPKVRILPKHQNIPSKLDKDTDAQRAVRDCRVDMVIALEATLKDIGRVSKYDQQSVKKLNKNKHLLDATAEQLSEDVAGLFAYASALEQRLQQILKTTEEQLPEPTLEREGE